MLDSLAVNVLQLGMNRQELETKLPEGYILISPEKGNASTKLHLKCPVGHDWETARLGNMICNDVRCPHCLKLKPPKNKLPVEEVAKRLDEMGYELMSVYSAANIAMIVKCKKCGNTKRSRLFNVKPQCSNRVVKQFA